MASLPVWANEADDDRAGEEVPHVQVLAPPEVGEPVGTSSPAAAAAAAAAAAPPPSSARRFGSIIRSTPRRLLHHASTLTSSSLSYLTPPSSLATPGEEEGGVVRRRSRGAGRGRRRTGRRISTSQMFDELERFSRRTLSTSTYSSAVAQEVSDALLGRDDGDDTGLGNEDDEVFAEGNGRAATAAADDQDEVPRGRPETVRGEGDGTRAHNEHAISNFETMVHIVKGNIGMGILTLPMAIRNSGLIFGCFALASIALICVYCMRMLVRSAHKACAQRPGIQYLDYGDTAMASFVDAGGGWVRFAPHFRRLVNTFLIVSQLLSNSVYVLFMAQNIQPVFVKYGGEFFKDLNYRFYILFLLGPMMLVCFIRNLRYLSPFSVIATLAQTVGIAMIFYYIFREPLPNSHWVPWMAEPARLPLFFGTAIFAIEGISVVLPIENQMRHPGDMIGAFGVLNTSMTIVATLYIAMGFYGYLKYGDTIRSCITLNLPVDDVLTQVVLILFCFAIFISYAIQFYVLMDVIQRSLIVPRLGETGRWRMTVEYLVRMLVNVITFALAATVPWLDLVVALLGAVKMSTLALMAPALVDTASHWHDLGRYRYRLVRNSLIFLFGLFGCVIGTYVSIYDMIKNFQKHKIK